MIIPYIVLGAAYLSYRLKGNNAPFTILKTKASAILVSAIILILGIAGFIGAGISDVVYAESNREAIIAIVMDYGGPIILILLGYVLVYMTRYFNYRNHRN